MTSTGPACSRTQPTSAPLRAGAGTSPRMTSWEAQYWRKMVCNEGDGTGMLGDSGKVRGPRAVRPAEGEGRTRRGHQRHGGGPGKAAGRSAPSARQQGAAPRETAEGAAKSHGVLPRLMQLGTGPGTRSAPLLVGRVAAPGASVEESDAGAARVNCG
ncbi:unnamed protein product [Prorocentrum cordatum]|uniref:Uncharacterized protein n=1 Tax=Prorocentrum cordatum TaxID=2364126 RepID=A0ABN9QTD8_9DINO|nr:unnamed protein product [Polarella glacialis]